MNRLPHIRQTGVTYFVTFRMADSIPKQVHIRWENEKQEWLERRSISFDPAKPIKTGDIPESHRKAFQKHFNRKLQDYLDNGSGSCCLKNEKIQKLLISKFEAVSSLIGDFVIMPNHVHLLVTATADENLSATMNVIKGGSAFEINKLLSRKGKLWQKDSFDHMVRSNKHLSFFRKYIANNPLKAGLSEGFAVHQANYTTLE